jgi:hypothetical protein
MPVILGGQKSIHYRMKLAFLVRYEDAKSAPKRTCKRAKISNFVFRGYFLDPRIKRGREGGEGLGRDGIGVWPTQKLSHGAPYEVDQLLSFM